MYDLTLREGSCEPITFTLHRGGLPYNLGTKVVRLLRRDWKKEDDQFATSDPDPLLVVTNALNGIVTFNPKVDTWKWDPNGSLYLVNFEVDISSGVIYTFPEATNLQIKIVPNFEED